MVLAVFWSNYGFFGGVSGIPKNLEGYCLQLTWFLNGIFAILIALEGVGGVLSLLFNLFQGDILAILIVLGKYSSNLMGHVVHFYGCGVVFLQLNAFWWGSLVISMNIVQYFFWAILALLMLLEGCFRNLMSFELEFVHFNEFSYSVNEFFVGILAILMVLDENFSNLTGLDGAVRPF